MDHKIVKDFSKRIDDRSVKICIVGLGYIGLPLACEFAEAGFKVLGVDVNRTLVAKLERGVSYIPEIRDSTIEKYKANLAFMAVEPVVKKSKAKVRKSLAACDVFVICVPTPLKYSGKAMPDVRYVVRAAEAVRLALKETSNEYGLAVLESTTYPGSTRQILAKNLAGLKAKSYVAYSPERTNPGASVPFRDVPKVVGAIDDTALEMTRKLYEPLYRLSNTSRARMLVAVRSPETSETVKCAENGFRLLSISFANELARHARNTKLDAWKLLDAMEKRVPDLNLGKIARGEVAAVPATLNSSQLRQAIQQLNLKKRYRKGATIRELAFIDPNRISTRPGKSVDYDRLAHQYVERFCHLAVLYLKELHDVCQKPLKISYSDMLSAILSKPYGLDLCKPGPGAGGHCIPIDPLYLLHEVREHGCDIPLLWEARQINEKVPDRIARLVSDGIHRLGRVMYGTNILVLGVTYKAKVPDRRESRAIDLIRSLLCKGSNVVYCDPVLSSSRSKIYKRANDEQERRFSVETLVRPEPAGTTSLARYCLDEIRLSQLNRLDKVRVRKFEGQGIVREELHAVVVMTDHAQFQESGVYDALLKQNDIAIIDTRNVVDPKGKSKHPNLIVWGRQLPE